MPKEREMSCIATNLPRPSVVCSSGYCMSGFSLFLSIGTETK